MENLLTKPNEMDFDSSNLAVAWKKWKQTMILFMEAVMRTKTETEKYSTFLYVIGQRGRDIFNTWKCGDTISVDMLFEKFEAYCLPKRNLLLERRRFFLRNQRDESVDMYLTELRNLASTCEFGTLHDDLILYKIVDGIKSENTTEKLLRKGPELTLSKAINICRAEELTRQQMMIMNDNKEDSLLRIKRCPGRSISFEGLDKYSQYEDDEESNGSIVVMNQGGRSSILRGDLSTHDGCSDAGFDGTSSVPCRRSNAGSECMSERSSQFYSCCRGSNIGKCNNCPRQQRKKCGQECRKCKRRMDNRSNMSCCNSCITTDQTPVYSNMENNTYVHRTKVPVVTYSDYHTQEIPNHQVEKYTYPNQTEVMFVLKINDKLVRAQMGTGAEVDVMPKRVYDLVADANATLNEIPMEHGDDITVYGSTEMLCSYKDKSVTVNFYVMDTDTITMLTMNTCHELNMI